MIENPSALEIAAYAAGGATLLGSLAAAIVSIITAFKVGKIEAQVNGQKTAAESRDAAKTQENLMLREMLAERKQAAALLAQAAAAQRHGPPVRQFRASDVPATAGEVPKVEAPVLVVPPTD